MNLKDFGSGVRERIRNLSKDELDQLLVDAGVNLNRGTETPKILCYTYSPVSTYTMSSVYQVVQSTCTFRIA